MQVLGPVDGSWAYSKTGKIAGGRGRGTDSEDRSWAEFGEPFGVGDVITAELEPREGRIRFFKNATHQGTAFLDPELASACVWGLR